MPIALSAGQNILELLEERLSPLRIGPAQQLLGLLPRQLAAVQGRADRLATAHEPEALAGPADQAAAPPTRRRNVQRGAGSAPSMGRVAAVRWAAQTTSPSSAVRCGQKRDGVRRC